MTRALKPKCTCSECSKRKPALCKRNSARSTKTGKTSASGLPSLRKSTKNSGPSNKKIGLKLSSTNSGASSSAKSRTKPASTAPAPIQRPRTIIGHAAFTPVTTSMAITGAAASKTRMQGGAKRQSMKAATTRRKKTQIWTRSCRLNKEYRSFAQWAISRAARGPGIARMSVRRTLTRTTAKTLRSRSSGCEK